jgi:hypothetical protein
LALAQALRDAGARIFFHIDEGASAGQEAAGPAEETPALTGAARDEEEAAIHEKPQPTREVSEATASAAEVSRTEKPAEELDVSSEEKTQSEQSDPDELLDAPVEQPQPVVDDASEVANRADPLEQFRSGFGRFREGQLDNDSILVLVEDAFDLGMLDKVRELLNFEPRDPGEAVARKRYLVNFYLATDRPATALEIIETIETDSLDDDALQDILMKKASCQRAMNDYEGAHKTSMTIVKRFPSPENDRIAKRNYQRYLQKQCGDAPVLEKTTSLHGE